jgi:glycosyltransferase involved in cell wall biosynthesis
MIAVSVVVPVYSGSDYLEQLVGEVSVLRSQFSAADSQIRISELILVDDDAIDGSAALIDRLAAGTGWITVVHLSRNFGQHAATIAGLSRSSGDWVVTLDEDLQHPPHRIVDLLRKVAETGCDIVYARPTGAVHGGLMRDFSSRTYKRLLEWITGNRHLRAANSFRLIRGSIARGAAEVCRNDIYFDVTLSWFSQRIQSVSMQLKDDRSIMSNQSGYRLRSLFSHARRMLASSQIKALRLGALFGAVVLAVSILGSLAITAVKLFDPGAIEIQGWASQFLVTTFFGGLCVFLLGILVEYVSILVMRSNGKPLFFVIDRSSDRLLETSLATEWMESVTGRDADRHPIH